MRETPDSCEKWGSVLYCCQMKGVSAVGKPDIWRLLAGALAVLTAAALTVLAASGVRLHQEFGSLIYMPPLVANPYTDADFVPAENGLLTFLPGHALLGVDVSEFQENIDWTQVKAAGVEFVMIRVGFRGYGDSGVMRWDDQAQSHYEGAKAAGLKVGAYFFSQAITPEEAVEEAEFLLRAVGSWDVDLPLVFDWEYIGSYARTADMDARTLTDCSRAFCRVIRRAGYTPMVYFNLTQARDLLYLEELTDFDWWLARYANTMDFEYRVTMWQYTDKGSIPGIEGEVDLNFWFPQGEAVS